MNILHIAFSDGHGGADIAAMRLNQSMNRWGAELKDQHGQNFLKSSVLVQKKMSDDKTVFTFGKLDRNIFQIVRRNIEEKIVDNRDKNLGLFSSFKIGHHIGKNQLVKEADIIYLHWICGGYLNLKNVVKILDLGKPVYWFCHDMFPFTGGCHHSFLCDGYQSGAEGGSSHCAQCQFFLRDIRNKKLAAKQFYKKKKVVQKYMNFRFIAPSAWLAECAEKSEIVSNHSVYCIKHPIDYEIFQPIDSSACKKMLGINENHKVIAFGAYGALTNVYKGYDYFRQALNILKKLGIDKITILLFGSSYNKTIDKHMPYKAKFTGILRDELSLVVVYNAADVYVVPSLAESLSNTTVESMSCGTPVAGFDRGGLRDLISEKTGALCLYKDADSLAHGIVEILENGKTWYSTREFIIANCSTDVIMKKHMEMWRKDGIQLDGYNLI